MTGPIARLKRLDAIRRRYLLTALGHLLAAKLLHLRLDAPAILARLRAAPGAGAGAPRPDPALMHWAIYGVGRRLPWRSDCLIQALAAKRWLDRAGLAGELHLGVRRDPVKGLTAHAWLTLDGEVVSGGPLGDDLAPLTGPTRDADARWTALRQAD